MAAERERWCIGMSMSSKHCQLGYAKADVRTDTVGCVVKDQEDGREFPPPGTQRKSWRLGKQPEHVMRHCGD